MEDDTPEKDLIDRAELLKFLDTVARILRENDANETWVDGYDAAVAEVRRAPSVKVAK